MKTSNEFIQDFMFGGLVSLEFGFFEKNRIPQYHFYSLDKLPLLPADQDIYFSPAMRKVKGNEKDDVLGSVALWVDYDGEEKPQWTITPTYAVFSGHGWHCYWLLDVPCLDIEVIETANKLLCTDLEGDNGCWNINRVLRVPGTVNNKIQSLPKKVELKLDSGMRYTLDEIFMLKNISRKLRHKVATGDSRGHRSRSERDWKVIYELVASGVSDSLVWKLYDTQPIGDKHREEESNHYLEHTLLRVHEKLNTTGPAASKKIEVNEDGTADVQSTAAIVEGIDGYYVPYRKGAMRKVSTFLLEPKLLLDGQGFNTEDSLVCDVKHDDFVWSDVTFGRDTFNSSSKMAKATPVAAWQWLGDDKDVKQLLPHLLERLKQKGLPKVAATKTLGLHKIGGQWMFLGNTQTISKNEMWNGFEGPLAWMSSKMENAPQMNFGLVEDDVLRSVGEMIPELNEPGAIWSMIGWYTASVLKPWIETQRYRFPILNVTGTKGSGKSSLIQRVFMPLFGQENPVAYDSGTTHFVALMLLGSSNAVPISFAEFRVDAVQRFLRFVLLAYDTGHDARGRADQTTVDYPLSAPFTLDGEDMIDDAAARERIVVARLHPSTIAEGTQSYKAFKHIQFKMEGIPQVAGSLIMKILAMEPRWEKMLKEARDEVFKSFPGRLPDRVRNNHIIAYFGILLWCNATGTSVPSALVLDESISSVFDIKIGRARTLVDDMVEYIINIANQSGARFKYKVHDGVFWFQITPAYDEWVAFRRRQGRTVLEKDAIKSQMLEAPYQETAHVVDGVWMHGVNLTKAFESGLDVPSAMNWREVRISI